MGIMEKKMETTIQGVGFRVSQKLGVRIGFEGILYGTENM